MANWHHARDRILGAIAGAQAFEGDHFPLPASETQLNNVTQPWTTSIKRRRSLGVPSLGAWKIVRNDGHVGFFPVLPRSGEAVFEVQRVLGDAMKEFPTLPAFFNAVTTPLFWHTHTLQMVLGDMNHIPHSTPIVSDVITITVE